MPLRHILTLTSAALVLLGSIGYSMRRATLRSAMITRVSDDTPVARIALDYGSGARPWSVIVDLLASNGASGSVTCDGDTTAVDIPLSETFSGPYTLTTTATYRSFGIPKTIEQTYTGTAQ